MPELLKRILLGAVYGIIAGFLVFLVVLLISALLPLVSLNAAAIGTIAGILTAVIYILTGRTTI